MRIPISKIVKIASKTLIVILLVTTSIIAFLYYYGERIVISRIEKYIFSNTDSIYSLKIDEIDFNLKSNSLVVHKIILNPDTIRLGSRPYTRIVSPELTISNINLRNLFINNELTIHSVKIRKPEIFMSDGKMLKFNSITKNNEAPSDTLLFSLVKKINIDTLELTEAIYDDEQFNTESPLKEKLPVINIIFSNFVIDNYAKNVNRNKFEVSDINLKINNIERYFNNNSYKIVVGEIRMSLIHQIIKAKNISLQPQKTTIEKLSTLSIDIPEIQLKSDYLKDFLKSDTIIISSLQLFNPIIEISQGKFFEKSLQINSIDLYDLIKNELKQVKIDTLRIINGQARMFPYQCTTFGQEFSGLNFDLFNFMLDNNSKNDPKRLFYGKNGVIHLDHFTLNHNDKIHQLTIDSIDLNTFKKEVTTGIINFKPITGVSNQNFTRINVISKGTTLNNVDLYKFYHDQQLNVQELHIHPSHIRLIRTEYERINTKEETRNLLLDKINGYFKSIYIDKITIDKSGLNYNYINDEDQNGYFKTNFIINLEKFSIDSSSFAISNKIFFANQFNLKFTTFALQLADNIHFLSIDTISISSKKQSAEITNLQLAPLPDSIISAKNITGKRLELLNFIMPKIVFTNADFHHAFFQKKLYIDSFSVNSPQFKTEVYSSKSDTITHKNKAEDKFYQLISNYLTNVEIKNIVIDKGVFSYIQYFKNGKTTENSNTFSAKLQNFQLDSLSHTRQTKLFYSDNIDLIIHNHLFKLADGIHTVNAKEIAFLTSQRKIYIHDARLYPDSLAPNFSKLNTNYQGTFPKVELSNCDLIKAFHSNSLQVDEILFFKPELTIMLNHVKAPVSKDSLINLLTLLPDKIKSLSVNNINVKEGKYSVVSNIAHHQIPVSNGKIDLTLSSFFVSQTRGKIDQKLSNFKITLSQFQYNLSDSLHRFSADVIEINKADSTLKCSNLKIEPKQGTSFQSKKALINLSFPILKASGVNFENYFESKWFDARQVIAPSPIINITNKNSENKQKFNPYTIDLLTPIKKQFNNLHFGELILTDIVFNYNGVKNVALSNFDIFAKDFNPSKNKNATQLFSCASFQSQIRNFKRTLPNGFYSYSIEKINFNSNGNLSANNIIFQPTYNVEEYFRRKKFQEDYVRMHISSIDFQQFDIIKLFSNNEISANILKLNIDSIRFFRDKRLPINPDKFAKLPQQLLREASIKISIDSTLINCGILEYKEQERLSKKPGYISISNIALSAFNLTNNEENISKNKNGKLLFSGMVMKKGALNAEMNFPLNSATNNFNIKGKCGSMPLPEFNSITESNMFLSLKEGTLNSLDFNFEANEDSAYGLLLFGYNDLKVSVLDRKKGSAKEDKFASFLANSFVIRSENSVTNSQTTPAKINADRDKKRSIVNFCWKSIFSGIKETLGIKTKETKAPE